jgi:hypothetical protein
MVTDGVHNSLHGLEVIFFTKIEPNQGSEKNYKKMRLNFKILMTHADWWHAKCRAYTKNQFQSDEFAWKCA